MYYCSAFNTVIPSILATKLENLGLSPPLWQWIFIFLTGRPQIVRQTCLTIPDPQYQSPQGLYNEPPAVLNAHLLLASHVQLCIHHKVY